MKILLMIASIIMYIYPYEHIPTFYKQSVDELGYTIAKSAVSNSKVAIFYIHGFNDYLFNNELVTNINNEKISFYAIELNSYGRNIDAKTLKKYHFSHMSIPLKQIHDAITKLNLRNKYESIILLGTSMGGLIATMYADKYSENVDGLILNSPFFNLNTSMLQDISIYILIKISSIVKDLSIDSDSINLYGTTISNKFDGEWEIDDRYKDIKREPIVYMDWLEAIKKSQYLIKNDRINLDVPILILSSDKSSDGSDKELLFKSDIVLSVKDMAKYGKKLGSKVTVIEIEDAIHDVFLSKKSVRERAYERMFDWMFSNYVSSFIP